MSPAHDLHRTLFGFRLMSGPFLLLVALVVLAAALLAVAGASGCSPAFKASRRVESPPDFAPRRGIVSEPVDEPLLFADVAIWRDGQAHSGRYVHVEAGKIVSVTTTPPAQFEGRVIDGRGKTLIPGLIDSHLHLLYDSGPDLLTRGDALISGWVEKTARGNRVPDEVYARGELRLLAGVTTVRVLGDGMYSLRYRDEIALGLRVGPRVLTAGLHVNGPAGYVTGGIGAKVPAEDQPHVAVELRDFSEIAPKLTALLDTGVDVIKLATTHGDLGFHDAKPDLPEEWVREIVRVSHARGVKVTAHSYGLEGDWAAVRGGVDGIEHLVNVPRPLEQDLVAAIKAADIAVCPTLSGSAHSVHKALTQPQWLNDDRGVASHVSPETRKDILRTVAVMQLPGFTRFALGEPEAEAKWAHWHAQSIANTRKLHEAGVRLIFGTDAPFVMGNFFHSVGNEIEALRLAGIGDAEILEMATTRAADALGLAQTAGRIEEGLEADLVLLPHSPDSDLKGALEQLELVVARGRVVYQRVSADGTAAEATARAP